MSAVRLLFRRQLGGSSLRRSIRADGEDARTKPMFESRFIFEQMPGRPSHHCASMAELPGGELFATWYAGTHEKHPDVAILCARLPAGARAWTASEVLVDIPGRPGGNTVVFHDGERTLLHFYDIIEGEGWRSALLYLDRSTDGGRTWEGARLFDDRPGIMVRHRPLRLSSGRILLPAYDEATWEGLCFILDDGGEAWRASGRMVADGRCIQPAVIERDDGSLHALLRAGEGGRAWECDSSDGGESWSRCVPSELRNPNSGADMIRLSSGEVIACFNDCASGRTPLTLGLSLDQGRTWAARQDLETDQGEYSYPTLMQASDGRVHLVYTWRRAGIKHVCFDRRWLDMWAGLNG